MKFVIAALLLAVNLVSCADEIPRDTVRVDRSDPKFVTASLVVFGPGDELFSCVGHACIRMECPTFELDRCFSYESERIVAKITAFFMGKLNMGLFSVASDEFFAEYRDGGRGATQYQLNLTPAAKQRLWKILDDKVAEGANLPYDYNRRGCAKSACEAIMAALKGERVQCAFWNPNVSPTRREKFCEELFASSPWNLFCLNAIVGTEVDNVEEVVTPKDLLAFLRKTHVNRIPILTDGGREILPAQPRGKASWFTPRHTRLRIGPFCCWPSH